MFIERSEHTARCARTHILYSNLVYTITLCSLQQSTVYSATPTAVYSLQRSTAQQRSTVYSESATTNTSPPSVWWCEADNASSQGSRASSPDPYTRYAPSLPVGVHEHVQNTGGRNVFNERSEQYPIRVQCQLGRR